MIQQIFPSLSKICYLLTDKNLVVVSEQLQKSQKMGKCSEQSQKATLLLKDPHLKFNL